MARDTTDALKSNGATAKTNATAYGNTASNINSVLTPTLTKLANGNGGYSDQDLNKMRTSSMQSIGGANSGVVGQAGLAAARTNNSGANQVALAQSGRDASSQLSDAALGVDTSNAQLKAQQQESALGELGSLYGTNVGAQTSNENASTNAYNAAEQASQNGFWRKFSQNALQNATSKAMGIPI